VAVNRARDDAPQDDEPDPRLRDRLQASEAVGLVEANLGLVLSVARRYEGRGVPFLDLVQEGNLALMRSVEAFDPSRGRAFSSHAYWRVREAVRQVVAELGWPVPMPPATRAAIARLARTERRLALELGRPPSARELATDLGMGGRRLATLRRLAGQRGPAGPAGTADGLDALGPLGPPELPDGGLPPDAVVLERMRVDVHAILAVLGPRERRVLQLRYGLVDGRRRTVEEVGRRLGVPPHRIRRIEQQAITRLRQAGRGEPLQAAPD